LIRLARTDEAIAALERAIKLNPYHEMAHYYLGFAGDPVGRGRRPAIDAAPNDIKCEQRPSQSRRSPSINELDASLLDVLPQLAWMRRAPKVSSSASTRARRVDPARS